MSVRYNKLNINSLTMTFYTDFIINLRYNRINKIWVIPITKTSRFMYIFHMNADQNFIFVLRVAFLYAKNDLGIICQKNICHEKKGEINKLCHQ